MIVYHVTSIKKLLRYIRTKAILPPVRAWETIKEAERFSKQTGRPIILGLKFPENSKKLEGHKNMARVMTEPYPMSKMFGKFAL